MTPSMVIDWAASIALAAGLLSMAVVILALVVAMIYSVWRMR